jgi:hypothetical protein
MKKLTNTAKVLKYLYRRPNEKASVIAKATGVPIQTVYQVKHSRKKDMALTMSASPAILLQYPNKSSSKNEMPLTEIRGGKVHLIKDLTDNVNSPSHYVTGGIETIDYIEAKSLNYNLGNVVKYVSRSDFKGRKLEDLKKAQWYLNRELANLEKSK